MEVLTMARCKNIKKLFTERIVATGTGVMAYEKANLKFNQAARRLTEYGSAKHNEARRWTQIARCPSGCVKGGKMSISPYVVRGVPTGTDFRRITIRGHAGWLAMIECKRPVTKKKTKKKIAKKKTAKKKVTKKARTKKKPARKMRG
jgi:hypothetical protein